MRIDSESDGINTVTFQSSSELQNTTVTNYYNVINHLWYKPIPQLGSAVSGSFNATDNPFAGPHRGVYPVGEYENNPQYRWKFHNHGLLIDISGSNHGEGIKPGTFSYYDNSNDHVSFRLKDDGHGNLYNADETQLYTQNPLTASISSSINYVGNIFYDHGLVVISETGSYHSTGSGQYYVSGGTNYSMSYDNNLTINTLEFTCVLEGNEFNWSNNPSLFSSSRSDGVSLKKVEWFDEHLNQTRSAGYNIIDPYLNPDFVRTEDGFNPYITHIGLYNSHDHAIMKTTFPHPIKKINGEKMTFKIQMDF